MPFDDANWNGGEGGDDPKAERWTHALEEPATAGLTLVWINCGARRVEFIVCDDLPAETVITAQIREPVPLAVISYSLPRVDGHMRVRVLTVPL